MSTQKYEDLPNLMLSPLAGYTDIGMRKLAKKYGCGITVTEMVSAKALSYKNENTNSLLFCEETGKKSVQLFGSEPQVFAEVVSYPSLKDFDVIDINMGCPQRKIISNGEGCALMKNPILASQIVTAVKNNTDKLVSVKFRKGFGDQNTAVQFAKVIEEAGADFLTVHGRTSNQQFGGKADWETIGNVVSAVKIPVFANGDVTDILSYDNIKKQTGCFGVAIGRGAIGKPYIFSQLLRRDYDFDLLSDVQEHIATLKKIYSDSIVANDIKKHIVYYVLGMRDNKELIKKIMQRKSTNQIIDDLAAFVRA